MLHFEIFERAMTTSNMLQKKMESTRTLIMTARCHKYGHRHGSGKIERVSVLAVARSWQLAVTKSATLPAASI
jgi:hypothetical protein